MKVIVLGAGVTGTASAWYLNQLGHEVTVIDRQPAAGMETSFANGGQISVSHAEPWANPSAPLKLLHWLAREDAPLLFRLRADPAQWRWGLRFLLECLPGRTRHNMAQLIRLGLYSRSCLQALRRDTGIRYDQLEKGILNIYTSTSEFEAAREPARIMREHGCDTKLLDTDEMVRIEPALAQSRHLIVGGSHAPQDESGDAHRFTQALAALAAMRGVVFRYAASIRALRATGAGVEGVEVESADGGTTERTEVLHADAYLVCLGSYSPLLLRSLGVHLNLYPAKGYSATLPDRDPAKSYSVSLTDSEFKIVFSRLGDRLRVAGTAEFNGYDTTLNPVRCRMLVRRLQQLCPGAADSASAEFWTGLRPSTPSNLPYIGHTRHANLFLNTGHGTLGWTQACGSGSAIADIISDRQPEVDFSFCQAH